MSVGAPPGARAVPEGEDPHGGSAGETGLTASPAGARPPDDSLPSADRGLRRAFALVSAAVVVACGALVLWQLHPSLLLRNTTANGGDMGAHVWYPAYLRDELLPNLRVFGWSADYYLGFPAGQFYFPLPALAIVALDLIMPYNVAFKLVTASGAVALPAAAFALGWGLRVRRPGPELFALAATAFLFFRGIPATEGTAEATIAFNQRIMGGPLVSVLAGEYSFTIALAFALCFLGALARSLDGGRRFWLPALLLAATVLSHLVVGVFAAIAALVVVAFRLRWVTLARAAAIGVVGALLTAFWSLPLLAGFPYTQNMRYEKITQYVDYLLPSSWWWVAVLAIAGVVIAGVTRDTGLLTVAVITALMGVVFVVWPELHAWNLRFLPFWYLGLAFCASYPVAAAVRGVSLLVARSWSDPEVLADEPGGALPIGVSADERAAGVRALARARTTTAALGLAAVAAFTLWQVGTHRGYLDFWAEWNYSGYQDVSESSRKPKAWPEFRSLLRTMGELPPGRATWEGGGSIDAYGTPLALMLLPHFTDHRIASTEGLYFESSATTGAHFMNVAMLSGSGNASNPVRGLDYRTIADFDLGVRQLQAMGVRYYLAHSDEAKAAAAAHPDLALVAEVPDDDGAAPLGWNVYEVAGTAQVAPLRYEPVVTSPRAGTQSECFGREPVADGEAELGAWECTAVGWWDTESAIDRPFAADGPEGWARVPAEAVATAPKRRLPEVEVTDVRSGQDEISFRVSRPGVPVVVRTSYYPSWVADGADGPWRLSPNLMVVVPTEERVELRFERSAWEWTGIVATLVGLAGLGGLIWWGRQSRRGDAGARRSGPEAGPGEHRPDPEPEAGERANPASLA